MQELMRDEENNIIHDNGHGKRMYGIARPDLTKGRVLIKALKTMGVGK